jgi:hypothetical protein
MKTTTLVIATIAASSFLNAPVQADDSASMVQNEYRHAYQYQLNSDSADDATQQRSQLRQRIRDDAQAADHEALRDQQRSQLRERSERVERTDRGGAGDRSMTMRRSASSMGAGFSRGGRH